MRKTVKAVALAVLLVGIAVCFLRQSASVDAAATQANQDHAFAKTALAISSDVSAIQQPTEVNAASKPDKMARIVETHEKVIYYTVSVPVHETHTKEVNYTVMRRVTEMREKNVNYTVMTQVMEEHAASDSDESQDRIIKTIKYVPECRTKTVSYTVTKMVPESRTKTISYKTCRMVNEKRQKTIQYTTIRDVHVNDLQNDIQPLDENEDPLGTNRCLK